MSAKSLLENEIDNFNAVHPMAEQFSVTVDLSKDEVTNMLESSYDGDFQVQGSDTQSIITIDAVDKDKILEIFNMKNITECQAEFLNGMWFVVDCDGDPIAGPFDSEDEAVTRAERMEADLTLKDATIEEGITNCTQDKDKMLKATDNVVNGKMREPDYEGKVKHGVRPGKYKPDVDDAIHSKSDKAPAKEVKKESIAAKLISKI